MTDRLKFTVSYSKTLNIGNYESEKYTLSQEFYEGTCTVERAFKIVKRDVEDAMGVTEE